MLTIGTFCQYPMLETHSTLHYSSVWAWFVQTQVMQSQTPATGQRICLNYTVVLLPWFEVMMSWLRYWVSHSECGVDGGERVNLCLCGGGLFIWKAAMQRLDFLCESGHRTWGWFDDKREISYTCLPKAETRHTHMHLQRLSFSKNPIDFPAVMLELQSQWSTITVLTTLRRERMTHARTQTLNAFFLAVC